MFLQSNAQARLPVLGIAASIENDSLAHAAGFVYLEETVKRLLSPAVSDTQFARNVAMLKRARCRVQTCNVFIPGYIKLTGPAADEQRVLGYVDTVLHRAKLAGIQLIVLGSGEARKLPEGVTEAAARPRFIALARKMAAVAQKYNCVIAIENLNSSETNFITTLAAANEVVTAVGHPHFRLTADIYHMLKEGESAASIEQAGKNLVHCHIAEREKRTAPGVAGDDFRPYLQALHKIGYTGSIMMECRWMNAAAEYRPAVAYLEAQLKDAYHISRKK
ncbi:sugar phosphate isomerase/epimerase family protein [Chitinophaga solisilvae]|uniref:sugar phosphate isomerase/epimerase family protein n=1 Tax=Chitinophaga solisilvae TaxID=1233460 RepID=UPI00136917DF|nr:sugar phosphate isomerase/epimerase family protein [Chitinophaga solisilvae]